MVLNGAKNVVVKYLSSHILFVITHYHTQVTSIESSGKVICRRKTMPAAHFITIQISVDDTIHTLSCHENLEKYNFTSVGLNCHLLTSTNEGIVDKINILMMYLLGIRCH